MTFRRVRVGLVLAAIGSSGTEARADAPGLPPAKETCDEASHRLFGAQPARLATGLKPPARLAYVAPVYPQDPLCAVFGGKWVGEALIGTSGRVEHVAVVRDTLFKPGHPECGRAIPDALRQWRFAPTLVQGKPTPVCMAVSVMIHVR